MEELKPFKQSVRPKSNWLIIRWLIFEPSRVSALTETVVGLGSRLRIILQIYWRTCLAVIVFWLLALLILALSEIPTLYPSVFRSHIIELWQAPLEAIKRFIILIRITYPYLFIGLLIGLVVGIAVDLFTSLPIGLAVIFAATCAAGLGIGLGEQLIIGWLESVIGGVTIGTAIGLIIGLRRGLIGGILLGLLISFISGLMHSLIFLFRGGLEGLPYSLAAGLAASLATGLAYFFTQLRLFILPLRYWQGSRSQSFSSSPYLNDEGLSHPIFNHDKNLIKWCKTQPEAGTNFANFLLQNRILQRPLAYVLLHGNTAGWLRISLLEKIARLKAPSVTIGTSEELKPKRNWTTLLDQLQDDQYYYEQQTNSNLKYIAFQKYLDTLIAFRQENLAADPSWNHVYFDTISHLITQAENKVAQLGQELAPIAFNPYQVGHSLEPGRDNAVFLGRDDLRNELEYIIRNAKNMPLFLIRGQRRVGKTSLLKFLPHILGKGFQIIFMDLQGSDYCPDIPGWLAAIRREVNKAVGLEELTPWKVDDNWLKAWDEVSRYLTEVAKNYQTTLLLCFDEYEALQERGFAAEPDRAAQLLAAMRSYSQHQQEVVFLFSGALYFDEIRSPDWAKYFVNSQLLEIGYLSQEKALQLITRPYQDFSIEYEESTAKHIYYLTQGHPALTQEICSYLVEAANQKGRHKVTVDDLEDTITKKIVVQHNHPLNRFWNEFCYTDTRKETVRQIIRGEKPTNVPALRSLLRHRFVLKTESGYTLCAPLFEMYVRAVDDTFFEV